MYDEVDATFRGLLSWDRAATELFATHSTDGVEWSLPRPVLAPDAADTAWAGDDPDNTTLFPAMPITRYGPVLLGFLQVLRGRDIGGRGFDGEMEVQLVCSRDGKAWHRVGDRRPILARGEEESWDDGLVWMGHSLIEDGDQVVAYYTGAVGGSDYRGTRGPDRGGRARVRARRLPRVRRRSARPRDQVAKSRSRGPARPAVQCPARPAERRGLLVVRFARFADSWAWNTIVREDVSDAKLARFLEVYDYLNCTVEGHILTRYGEPGVHFDWHGEPYNSYAQRRDGVRPEGGESALRFYSSYFQPREWNVFLDNPDLAEVATYYRDTVGPDEYLILPHREDLFKETNYLEVRAKCGAALETMVIEFWFKAMIGSVDIDAEWDSYVQNWLDA